MNFETTPYKGAEMLPYERAKLYNWIIDLKPTNILEVGCGCGGATYYMAEAIKNGHIYTCDPKRALSTSFLKTYPFVEYHRTRSDVFIQDIIDRNLEIDFIMFDGPENPNVALKDIRILEKYITSGTYFCMHDWEQGKRRYDGQRSVKARKIRSYIGRSKKWEKIEIIPGSKKSVGLCLYKLGRT